MKLKISENNEIKNKPNENNELELERKSESEIDKEMNELAQRAQTMVLLKNLVLLLLRRLDGL